jgi:hypothetical protein
MEEIIWMVPQRRLDMEFNEPPKFDNFDVCKEDKRILRELALKKAEIASLGIHKKKISMWKSLNDLKDVRPMIWMCEFPWHELNDDELKNTTSTHFTKFLETRLRRTIYQWNHMPADMVVEPVLPCYLVLNDSIFGLPESKKIVRSSPDGDIISREFLPQIRDYDDISKIKDPVVSLDTISTNNMFQSMKDVFDGILEVKLKGIPGLDISLWDQLVQWTGVQNALMDLAVRPDFINSLLERMLEVMLKRIKLYEDNNFLSLNGCNYRVGSGGLGYTDELPKKDYDGDHLRSDDLWVGGTAQIFSAVSPEMHDEFALKYEIPYMEKFGLVYYGCCEPLDKKIDILRKIRSLRKISMSPWADLKEGAEKIGRDYVFSCKPNPAIFASDNWDIDSIRNSFRNDLDKIKGCRLEIIMKDISTIRSQPHRLEEWMKMATEEVEKI